MEDFENTGENNKQEGEKGSWVNAMEAWNELFLSGPYARFYDLEKDAWQPYLTADYTTDDGKTHVEARLYPDDSNPDDFILMANSGDTMAMLEMAGKLLEKNINVIRIGQGNGIFRPGDSQEFLDSRLEELRKKFNR